MPLSRISNAAGELASAGRNISSRSASTSLIWRKTSSKPIDLAKNLRLDVSWQRASVSGSQFFQTFPAVLVQRIIVGDSLAKQQSSNAVRVLNALPQQRRALARDPTGGLFARSWRHCHGTDPRLAARPGHQREELRLGARTSEATGARLVRQRSTSR